MALSPGQIEVSQDQHRFRVVIAGRRWGKTYLSIRELAKAARQPNRRCYYVAPTYRMAKQIVWDQLKYRLQDLNWIARINESDLTIQLVNGSKISLRGADNPDSLRGVGLDFVCLDEFAWIDQRAWTEVLRPTLSDRNGQALFISTPMGTSNWAYDLWQNHHRDPENWSSYQFTTLSGGRVSAEEIAQAELDLDERQFRQEYLATFETYAGRIFYSFDQSNIVRATEPNLSQIYIGADFNVNPICAAIGVRYGEVMHIIDEIYMHSSNTNELVDEIKHRYPKSRVIVYPDPAGSARKTSAGGATDHNILSNAGFTVKAPNRHDPVRDGINAVNARLHAASGDRYLYIDPKCKHTIEALERFCYKEGTQVPDKDSGYDHMADAVRYMITYIWPVKRDIIVQAPQRWGHKIA